ncbi:hypothetical protein Bpfe_006905 [Biomphalaria pfeifferi]|uniref:Uncharacterized protein n=1 Tax=Biomphalaria pfeifferi TaxID=112525 RepID=A0AAD8FHW8_BIOPF|nr:hypothetical protein Bpfe_006905 [Biomphalaria pfeifferi]
MKLDIKVQHPSSLRIPVRSVGAGISIIALILAGSGEYHLLQFVFQGITTPNPTPREIVKYQAYNSDSTPAESQACVPNTGEEHHIKAKQENSTSRQNKRTPPQGKTRELHLKTKQENNDTNIAHP